MTREEAIQILSTRDAHGVLCGYTSGVTEALDMAISALHFEADCRSCMWREKYEELTEQTEPSDLMSHEEAWNTIESDLISRKYAIEALREHEDAKGYLRCDYEEVLEAIPSANPIGDLISRADAMNAFERGEEYHSDTIADILSDIPSADRPTEDYSDLPDIPRAYYEKIVGNMSHEINMLKQQLEDRPSGEWKRKEKEYNDCDGHRAYYWYECSKCGAKPPKNEWKQEWHSPYCPSCGAYMVHKESEK